MNTITDSSLPISLDSEKLSARNSQSATTISNSSVDSTSTVLQKDVVSSSNIAPTLTSSHQSPSNVVQSKAPVLSPLKKSICDHPVSSDTIKSPSTCHTSSGEVSSSSPIHIPHNHVEKLRHGINSNEQRYILLQICPIHDLLSKQKDLYGTDFIANSLVTIKFSQKDLNFIFELFTSKITLHTREFSKQLFEQCFDGASAMKVVMDIISQHFKHVLSASLTLEKLSLHIGQYFLTTGKFEHVLREHCFKNVNTLFYHLLNNSTKPLDTTPPTTPLPYISSFATIKLPKSPNWFLLIPQSDTFIAQHSTNSVELFQCPLDAQSNVYTSIQYSPILRNVSLSQLKYALLHELLPQEEGVEMLLRNDDIGLFTFLQRTKFQEYPDYITIQLLSVRSMHRLTSQSTFAAFSISKYGYSDWGANKERLLNWSDKLVKLCQSSE
nr:unnamed protein product [Naegleria fowleri]